MSNDEILNSLNGLMQMVNSLNQRVAFIQRDVDGLKNHILLDGQTVVTLKNGVKVHVPNQLEDAIQRTMVMNRDFYELEILNYLDQLISEDSVILDVGANIGNHSLYWLSKRKSTFVYAFEPVPVNFEILEENIKLNTLEERVELFKVGLSNTISNGSIVKFDGRNRGGTVIEHNDIGELELVTLDSLHFTRKIDFIKIDVEGFEASVLEGGAELIKRDKPPICIEIFPDSYAKTSKILESFGYRVAQKLPVDNYLWMWLGST